MFIHYLGNLGMGGGSSIITPPLLLQHIDPDQTTEIPQTTDLYDIDPAQTILLGSS